MGPSAIGSNFHRVQEPRLHLEQWLGRRVPGGPTDEIRLASELLRESGRSRSIIAEHSTTCRVLSREVAHGRYNTLTVSRRRGLQWPAATPQSQLQRIDGYRGDDCESNSSADAARRPACFGARAGVLRFLAERRDIYFPFLGTSGDVPITPLYEYFPRRVQDAGATPRRARPRRADHQPEQRAAALPEARPRRRCCGARSTRRSIGIDPHWMVRAGEPRGRQADPQRPPGSSRCCFGAHRTDVTTPPS